MDLRLALRMLRRAPGFTAVAVLTLALGIGINTVTFTLYEGVALKPIAARAPGELVRISGILGGERVRAFSYGQYQQIREQTRGFSAVIATSAPQTIVGRLLQAGSRDAEVLRARLVSDDYFAALGLEPRLGRGFQSGDRAVAIISHDYWQQKLHGDPAALSHAIQVQGTAVQIVGVAPPDFAGTGEPPAMPDLWIPLAAQAEVIPGADWLHNGDAREWQVLARRKPGTGIAQAAAELEVLARTWPPVNSRPAHLVARPATFFQADSGEFETFVQVCWVLMIAVGLILMIGAVNLVNLLFARNAAREREFAVRLSLGARRIDLIRQLSTESAVVGLAGGGAGLLLSLWVCEWIRERIGAFLQHISGGLLSIHLNLTPDWRTFGYTVAISLAAGLAIGLWPAAHAGRRDVHAALQQGWAGSVETRRKRNWLLASQVAACLMLLVVASGLFRGVRRSGSIDPGFEMKHLLVAGINPSTLASTPMSREALLRRAVERIRELPETTAVAWADRPPFLAHGSGGFENERGGNIPALFNRVSDAYFDALGVPFLAGRNFTPQEIASEAPVVVINDVAARAAWPHQDPLGRQIRFDFRQAVPYKSATVIGVVRGVRSTFLSKPDEAYLYFPKPFSSSFGMLMVRTRASQEAAKQGIFGTLTAVNANLPSQTYIVGVDQAPLEIQKMMAEAPAMVASALGGIALLLAAVGVFGLVSQLVVQRTREIAIRVALGAQHGDVARLVMGQTLRPVLGGAAVGLAGAVAVSTLVAKMVVAADMPDLTYGAGAFHGAAFGGALGALAAAVFAASIMPMLKAVRIAPAEALRHE